MSMYKRCACLISLVFLLGMVVDASAVDRNWTNGNGNRLWSTAANWSGSVVPTSSNKAGIRNQAVSGPIIQSGITAVANEIVVGDFSSTNDTITMTGGTLTTSGTNAWIILGYGAANKGTFTLSAGTVTTPDNFFVGFNGKGYVEMTGGSITVGLNFGIAKNTGSIANVNLHGGTITVNGTFTMSSGGDMDITTGTLIVNGDVTSTINTYKTNGWITAYGGTGVVNLSYNTPNVGKTTVTAAPPAGVDRNWDNGSGNRLWRNAVNWSGNILPTSSNKAAVRNAAISGPIVDSSTNAQAFQVVVGDWSSTHDTLDMTGGTLTANYWFILGYGSNNNGTFTMSSGTVSVGSDMFVGFNGTGTLEITAGSITVTNTFGIAQQSGAVGDVFLDGGTITCGSFNMTSGGAMDITAGTLIVNGDVTSTINTYKTNGWITAYGGSGTVNVSYNTPNVGKTTVTGDSTTPPPGGVINGDFEDGSGELPDYWTKDAWQLADANFTWETNTGMGASKCVSIFIDPPLDNDAWWKTTVENLEPGNWYNVRGYIKGENITGSTVGANLSLIGTWDRSEGKVGTFDWQQAIFSFRAETSSAEIGARMGYWGSTVSGKAWFDNITLNDDYGYSYGQHINLALEETDLNVIEWSKLQEWNNNLDMAYESYQELVGGVPYGGNNIEVASVRQYPGGWAVAGNPILWQQPYVSQTLQRIGDNNDWSFGILHEIGHDFDIDPNWNFHGEFMANFKMYYVAEDLNTIIYQDGAYYEGNDLKYYYQGFYNQADYNQPYEPYENPVWGGVLYRFILISEELGWDTFKDTYRSYSTDPPSPTPSTNVEKFDLLLNRLLFYSGRESDDPNTLMPQLELDWIRNNL